jgi:hypothetical protein
MMMMEDAKENTSCRDAGDEGEAPQKKRRPTGAVIEKQLTEIVYFLSGVIFRAILGSLVDVKSSGESQSDDAGLVSCLLNGLTVSLLDVLLSDDVFILIPIADDGSGGVADDVSVSVWL